MTTWKNNIKKKSKNLTPTSEIEFRPDGSVEIIVDLGENGSNVKMMFFFKNKNNVFTCHRFRKFIPGEKGRGVELKIEVDCSMLLDNNSIGLALDEAWINAYRKNILAEQIEFAEYQLTKLWNLRQQLKKPIFTVPPKST